MAKIRLQYSLVCQRGEKLQLERVLGLLTPEEKTEFYVSNKWVWLSGRPAEDGFFQVTELLCESTVMASSRSTLFSIRYSHIHHNHFQDILFHDEKNYLIKISLFDGQNCQIKQGSLEYPLFIRNSRMPE